MNLKKTLLATAIIGLSAQVLAAEPRDDYDLDDNGLIEINSLQDLDAMRNYRDAESEFNLSTAAGCPEVGCTGFELTTDLNFDTNGDGVINASDEFWNEGSGWEPVGDTGSTFGAIFDGNNHVIRNLYINRPESDNVGLFGVAYRGSGIRNLAIGGTLTSVTGGNNVGILIGRNTQTEVTNVSTSGSVQGSANVGGLIGRVFKENSNPEISSCYSTADVTALSDNAGGLVGDISGINISHCFSMGNVSAESNAGGLAGIAAGMTLRNTYASGNVNADHAVGGLIGTHISGGVNIYTSYASGNVTANDESGISGGLVGQGTINTLIANSHWSEETGQEFSTGNSLINGSSSGYSRHTKAILSCPTAANDTDCTPDTTLYQDWTDSYTLADETVVNYWDFGTASQMPVLTAQGYVLRDRDGDGIWDFNDAYPDDPTNTAPKSSSGSSGGGSLIWLLGFAPLMLRRKSKA